MRNTIVIVAGLMFVGAALALLSAEHKINHRKYVKIPITSES